MGWNTARAEARIQNYIKTVPEVEQGVSLAKHLRLVELAQATARPGQFPRGKAVRVDGVHLYGTLLDFENLVADNKVETERSHARVLTFSDMHYRVWDSIVGDDDCIRVDYHGPRIHVVITEPEGDSRGQIERSIALALKLGDAAKQVGDAHGFPSRVRFGIDQGACLAMSTGRAHEKDVLFLGSPANHAAKLVAASDAPGVYLTENAQRILGLGAVRNRDVRLEAFAKSASDKNPFSRIDLAAEAVAKADLSEARFKFHRAIPPLAELNYEELVPSNSVRMGMASLFADIDGFTAYVDGAIQKGADAIATAVRDIHVLREELNSVLKEDFGGKRVRFIGDCIHGVIAEGAHADDPKETVREATFCATGMRSSFDLAKRILGTIGNLDLAVGLEYGQVPLTRLGLQGAGSVRCAVGLAVILSERLQQSIDGGGIKVGADALSHASTQMQDYFYKSTALMEYADAADLFGADASPVVQVLRHDDGARPHSR